MKNHGLVELCRDDDFLGEALAFATQEVGRTKNRFSALQAIEVLQPYLKGLPSVKEKLDGVKDEMKGPVIDRLAILILLRGVEEQRLYFWK